MIWLYQYPPLPFYRSYKKLIENLEKLPPLDHGGPEMKCTYFHRNCCKKIAQNDMSHAMDISRITKVILKYCQKIVKTTHLL